MSGAETPRRMRLVGFRPFAKGSLRGFASVDLPIGLRIMDCPVFVNARGQAWAALPSKPVLDREGRNAEAGSKKQYAAILEWRDRELSDRFSAAVVDLVRAADPDALAESSP